VPDLITAFAVSKPQLLLTESAGFFGLGGSASRLAKRITQPTPDRSSVYLDQPFQPSTIARVFLPIGECCDGDHYARIFVY
ncbi:MAG: hypothetical protein WA637_16615, partial [Terriglobales bacterium]